MITCYQILKVRLADIEDVANRSSVESQNFVTWDSICMKFSLLGLECFLQYWVAHQFDAVNLIFDSRSHALKLKFS